MARTNQLDGAQKS